MVCFDEGGDSKPDSLARLLYNCLQKDARGSESTKSVMLLGFFRVIIAVVSVGFQPTNNESPLCRCK